MSDDLAFDSNLAFDPDNPCPRGSDPGTNANIAIIEALGLNPRRLQKGATITLGPLGPVLECTINLLDHRGKVYAIGDRIASVSRRYRLIPIEDETDT